VSLPDGRTVDVDTDDPQKAAAAAHKFRLANPAEIPAPQAQPEAQIRSQMDAQNVPTFAPRDPTKTDYPGFANDIGIGAQKVGAGAADIAGMPVDLVTAGLNAGSAVGNAALKYGAGVKKPVLPTITNPVGGSQSIKNAATGVARAFGYPVYEDQRMNDAQRFA